jgi:hypothetical protein
VRNSRQSGCQDFAQEIASYVHDRADWPSMLKTNSTQKSQMPGRRPGFSVLDNSVPFTMFARQARLL